MEGTIQSSGSLAQATKDLNSHTQGVARKVYDKMKGSRRNVFLTNLNKHEGRKFDKPIENSEMDKRKERDRNEADELKQKAQKFMSEYKKQQEPWDERPTAIKEDDEKLLKSVFSKEMLGMFYHLFKLMTKTYSDINEYFWFIGINWKEKFYDAVETLQGADGDALRELELRIFSNTLNAIQKKVKGKWNGSKRHNFVADNMIRCQELSFIQTLVKLIFSAPLWRGTST